MALTDALFESKLALGIAGAGAIAVGVLGVMLWQRPAAPGPVTPAPAAASWNGPIGPGLLSSPVREPPAAGLEAEAMRGAKISVDAGGHLVADAALRQLMDAFLVSGARAQRPAMAAQLRSFLQASLRPPASGEADRLVTDYLAYLGAEEQMLARERFDRPDPAGLSGREIDHLMAWQQQRSELRQRMLGIAVTRAWFVQEDADCGAAFEDWRRQRDPEAFEEGDAVEQATRRRFGNTLELRRNYNAQACAAQVMSSLAPHGRS
jgi:hypothetical protein